MFGLKKIQNFWATGERPFLKIKFEDMASVLQFAYQFVGPKIKEQSRILDYGCGGGYGTEYLARFTKGETVGFDTNRRVVKNNKKFFAGTGNLEFTAQEDWRQLYDIIVCFQVIEHIKYAQLPLFLSKLKKYLSPGGTLFVATVNKNISSYQLRKPIMPYHFREFTPGELTTLLQSYFSRVQIHGQIETKLLDKVRNQTWFYQQPSVENRRRRLVRLLSQWELVRAVARHLPYGFKSWLLGYEDLNKIWRTEYCLTDKSEEIDNSYILICECQV